LSTKIVNFSYPKLLSFSVLTFIKWRLTPSYAAKDTIFWQKRPKTIVIGIIVQDNKNSNLFIWPSMWTRLEHANSPTDPLHISCICSIWKILHFYSSFSLNLSKSAFFHALTLSLYPKLLSFSVLTFIKWRLTPSYAAKDTIFWQKRPKSIIIGIIV
jgi:hypothetical protein